MKLPYIVIWTGNLTGLSESCIAWDIVSALNIAKSRGAVVYTLELGHIVELR